MQGVMVGQKGRPGTCHWCGRHNVRVKYTVYALDGSFHGARVCEKCLAEYKESLRATIHGQYVVFDGGGDETGETEGPYEG